MHTRIVIEYLWTTGALLAQVRKALQRDAARRREAAEHDQARGRCTTLTRRELDILPLVAPGTGDKDIGRQLGISHHTVELHRMRIMRKTAPIAWSNWRRSLRPPDSPSRYPSAMTSRPPKRAEHTWTYVRSGTNGPDFGSAI
jgi:DNA-binding CsgD family transcriptional regulator